jgi:hypothetical protein
VLLLTRPDNIQLSFPWMPLHLHWNRTAGSHSRSLQILIDMGLCLRLRSGRQLSVDSLVVALMFDTLTTHTTIPEVRATDVHGTFLDAIERVNSTDRVSIAIGNAGSSS